MSKVIADDKKFYDLILIRKNKIYNEAFKVTKDGTPIPSIIEIAIQAFVTESVLFALEVILAINM